MSSAELVSPGIYRIVVANSGARPDVLTRHGEKDIEVTTLPATEVPEPKQEVINCFPTSSVICRSLAILVENLL